MNLVFAHGDQGSDSNDGLQPHEYQVTGMTYTASTRRLENAGGMNAIKNDVACSLVYLHFSGLQDGVYMLEQGAGDDTYRKLATWDASLHFGDDGYLPRIPGVLPAPTSDDGSVSTGTGPKRTGAAGLALVTGPDTTLHIAGGFCEQFNIPVAGDSSQPNMLWGYDSYPGDETETKPVIAGTSYAINAAAKAYWIYRHLKATGASAHGIYAHNSSYNTFDDVVASSNAGVGIYATGSFSRTLASVCEGNGSHGISTGLYGLIQDTLILSNGSTSTDYGINAGSSVTILNSGICKNHRHQISLGYGAATLDHLTIDAYGAASSTCILYALSGGHAFTVTDCILAGARDTVTYPGAFYVTDASRMSTRVRNIIDYDNTPVALKNIYSAENVIAGDPLFKDRAMNEYRLKTGSPAAGRGTGGGNIGCDPRHLTHLRTPFAGMAA